MVQKAVTVGVPRELTTQNRMGRAGVTPASSIPRIQFSTGTAKALSDFSSEMFQMSSRMEDELDQQAAAEGQVEGAAAGATGQFETRDYTTIRNRAYNQAGIQTFASTLETRSIVGTAEIQRQYANDPAGMARAMQEYHQGIAGELSGVSPGAGTAYLQRAAARTVPAVERARDAAFTLTRDHADAMLIQSQVALNAELESHAADLFSDNPDRSRAAATAVGVVGAELMRVYDAVDQTTGRPLYSASERAKAQADFTSTVFSQATLSWFDQQEDKSQAYLDFVNGDFTIDLAGMSSGDPTGIGWVNYTNQSAVRNDPLSERLISSMSFLPSMGISMEVFSGGQENNTTQGLGSIRHNHGDAADVLFFKDGRKLSWANPSDVPIFQEIVRRAKANGVTGFGAGQGYMQTGSMHIGFGNPAVWGKGGQSVNAPEWLTSAYNDASPLTPIDPEGGQVSLRNVMPAKSLAVLDAEMRSQIGFANSLADREQREEDRANTERQEIGFSIVTDMYLNGGRVNGIDPLTRDAIQGMLKRQEISYAHARRALEWMATPAPDTSNQAVFEELQRRMYAGDDIEDDIQGSLGQLSKADASALLTKNNGLNSEAASRMTEEQRGYLGMIRQTVAPEGMLAQLDAGASMRAFNAQDEYRKRIGEGEDAATVARDIVDRAQRDTVAFEAAKIQRMLRPRFAVSEGSEGRIDIQSTALAQEAAKDAGTISEDSYQRQRKLVLEWAKLQGEVN